VFNGAPPLNYDYLEKLVTLHSEWVALRTADQPHEMITGQYNTSTDLSRVFDINVLDVVSGKFPSILTDILAQTQLSDNFSTDYLQEFHQNYIDAQPNLQWFASIAKFNETGVLDQYLLSHSYIQASVLLLLAKVQALPNNWERMSTVEINDLIQSQRG
jgi:hypothetical protein